MLLAELASTLNRVGAWAHVFDRELRLVCVQARFV
jgi:hypothetical protein